MTCPSLLDFLESERSKNLSCVTKKNNNGLLNAYAKNNLLHTSSFSYFL